MLLSALFKKCQLCIRYSSDQRTGFRNVFVSKYVWRLFLFRPIGWRNTVSYVRRLLLFHLLSMTEIHDFVGMFENSRVTRVLNTTVRISRSLYIWWFNFPICFNSNYAHTQIFLRPFWSMCFPNTDSNRYSRWLPSTYSLFSHHRHICICRFLFLHGSPLFLSLACTRHVHPVIFMFVCWDSLIVFFSSWLHMCVFSW